MPSHTQQSIWKQMNYTPPRGSCNHKESLLSPKCPCLRFMLHPLKVTSSFSCDGCGHHASFHNMSSPADDAVIARWSSSTSSEQQQQPAVAVPDPAPAPRSRKRPRRALIEAAPSVTNSASVVAPTTSSSFAPTEHEPPDALDGSFLFSEDVEWVGGGGGSFGGGSSDAGGGSRGGAQHGGSRTWGDRFSSWSFGRAAAEEPVKTPPKRQQGGGGGGHPGEKRKKSGRVQQQQQQQQQQQRHQQRDEDEEGRSEVVDLD